MGNLVFQATLGGQVNLVGPNTASTYNLNVPTVSSTLATLAAQTFAGTQTFSVDAVVNGLTVGRGAGSVSTNTAVGASALAANTTAANMTAVGYQAGYSNTDGGRQTFVGYQAGYSNTSGIYSTATGYQALYTNSTGGYNSAYGYGSLLLNTTGSYNVGVGNQALFSNTTASYNTAVGYQAAYANTTASDITAMGYQSLLSNTTGGDNSAFGLWGLKSNTTGANNTSVGSQALYSNTTANNNTAVGYQAAYSNTTGTANTAVGHQSLYPNTTGSSNSAFGRYALSSNTTGSSNTALGVEALNLNTTGSYNTCVGYQAGYSISGSGNTLNTCVGFAAGYSITTGTKNTILGSYNGNQGGLDIRTLSNYIVLSDGDGNPRCYFNGNGHFLINNPASNYGWLTVSSACNTVKTGLVVANTDAGAGTLVGFINSAGNTAGSITQTGTTTVNYGTSSDYRLKDNPQPMTGALAKVVQLKPVTYTWKDDGSAGEGFIAHELQEVAPQCVVGEKDAVDDDGKPVYQTIDTSFLVATLTAAIQELKAEFDAYKEAHP